MRGCGSPSAQCFEHSIRSPTQTSFWKARLSVWKHESGRVDRCSILGKLCLLAALVFQANLEDIGGQMEPYANLGGDSNVVAFEIGPDRITVQFASGRQRFYTYTYASAGRDHVEHMKELARRGQGLNSYIGTSVRNLYESKW